MQLEQAAFVQQEERAPGTHQWGTTIRAFDGQVDLVRDQLDTYKCANTMFQTYVLRNSEVTKCNWHLISKSSLLFSPRYLPILEVNGKQGKALQENAAVVTWLSFNSKIHMQRSYGLST
jgi:hypothetical protein